MILPNRRLRWAIVASLASIIVGAIAYARSKPDADALFRQARADLADGAVPRASDAIARLERLRPPNPFDRLLRAQVAEAFGRPDDALSELAWIDDRHPLAPVARLLSGQIEVRRGRLRPAESAFLAAIVLEPGSPKPRQELVYLYNLQHRQRELDGQLSAMSELGALDHDYLVHWAKTRHVFWSPEKDSEILARCVAADPGDRASRLALAEGLWRMNRPDEAMATLAPIADSDPEARPLRALIAMDRGDEEGLERWLSGAPADEPRLAALRGRLALKDGHPAEAVHQFRIALADRPDDRSILFGLGNALRQAGDPSAAEPYFVAARKHDEITPLVAQAALRTGKLDPTLPAKIAAACEAAGRPLEAAAWYRLAVARDPLDGKSQQGLARTVSLTR